MTEINTFLPAPFIFGNWTTTPYCNESCGDNRFRFELRTCSPISPNLPDNITCENQLTLRTGNLTCPPSSFNCTGKQYKTQKEENLQKMKWLMCHCIKVTSSSGLRGVSVNQIVARASRETSQQSGAGTEVTSSTPKVSSKLRSNLAPLTAHQVRKKSFKLINSPLESTAFKGRL